MVNLGFVIYKEGDLACFLETDAKTMTFIRFNFPISKKFTKAINKKIRGNPAIELRIDGYFLRYDQVHWQWLKAVSVLFISNFGIFYSLTSAEMTGFSKLVNLESLSLYRLNCNRNLSFVTFKKLRKLTLRYVYTNIDFPLRALLETAKDCPLLEEVNASNGSLTFEEIDRKFNQLNRNEKLKYIISFLNTDLNFGCNLEEMLDDAFETGVFDLASVDELDTIKTTLKHLNAKIADIVKVLKNEPTTTSIKENLIGKFEFIDKNLHKELSEEMEKWDAYEADDFYLRPDPHYIYTLTHCTSSLLQIGIKQLKGILTNEKLDTHFWQFIVHGALFEYLGYLMIYGYIDTNDSKMRSLFILNKELGACKNGKAIDELVKTRIDIMEKPFFQDLNINQFFEVVNKWHYEVGLLGQ